MGAPTRDPMRGLVSTGPSRVGISKAMRARDVSREDVDELGSPGEPVAPEGEPEPAGEPGN